MVHIILRDRQITILFLAVACCLLLGSATPAAAQDYVVVVNKNLGITNISSSDLEAVFTGKKKFWDSGEKVVFAVYNDEDIKAKFLKQHVHKTPSQFKNYWTKMVFTGKGGMPEYLNTPQDIIAFISSRPGGISFIPAPVSGQVKMLNIN